MGSQASSLMPCLFQDCCLAPEGGAPAYWTLTSSWRGVVSLNDRHSSEAHPVQGTVVLLPVGAIYHGTGKHYSIGEVQSVLSVLLAPLARNGTVAGLQALRATAGQVRLTTPVATAWRAADSFVTKTAKTLIQSHDLVAYEDLQIANMGKNRRLAKGISEASWGAFLVWLQYYGQLTGVPVVAVSPSYTSQECSGTMPAGTSCRTRV